jgi:hypothetical protein
MKRASTYLAVLSAVSAVNLRPAQPARAGVITGSPVNTFITTDTSKDITLTSGSPTFTANLTTYNTFLSNVWGMFGYAQSTVGLADFQHQEGPTDVVFGDVPVPYAMVGRMADGSLGTFAYKFQLPAGSTTGAGASINASIYFRGTPAFDGSNEYLAVHDTIDVATNLTEVNNANDFTKRTIDDIFGANPNFGSYFDSNVTLSVPAGLNQFYVLISDAGSNGRLAISNFTVNGAVIGGGDPTWAVNASGDWNVGSNWSAGVPNSVGAKAILGSIISLPKTVYTDTAVTLGSLKFDNASSYQIAGQGNLTLEVSTGVGSISVVQGNHKINLPLTFASDTNVTVAGGATLTIGNPATINAGKTVTASGNMLIQAPLSVQTGGSLVLAPGMAVGLFGAPALNGSAKIDVTSGSAVVDYHGLSSPLATIQAQISAGYASGAWTGNGITSSDAASVAATPGSHRTAVGYADNAVAGYTTFGGRSVDANSVLVRYTYSGDANLDGGVDTVDFNLLAASFSQSGKSWFNGDFDFNGNVDTVDFNLLASNFSQNIGPAGAVGSTVPEPGVASIVALASLLGLTRTNRRARATRVTRLA